MLLGFGGVEAFVFLCFWGFGVLGFGVLGFSGFRVFGALGPLGFFFSLFLGGGFRVLGFSTLGFGVLVFCLFCFWVAFGVGVLLGFW